MATAIDKLDKILRLEQSQGYRNKAVIGGLDSFADLWKKEAEAERPGGGQADQIEAIAALMRGYAANELPQRAEVVETILRQMEGLSDAKPPPRKPAPQKPSPTPVAAAPRPNGPNASGLDSSVTTLPGISTALASRLANLDIATVGDLLYHVPHRYEDYSVLKPINRLEYGEETTIIGTIWETRTRQTRGGGSMVTSVVADASGTIEAVWFNQPFLAKQMHAGRQIVLSGKVSEHLGRLTLQSPEWEPLEKDLIHTARLVPIYPLTHGISARWMRRLMKRVIDHWAPRLDDPLPTAIQARVGLTDLATALRQIHFPDSPEAAREARRRLAFDEFFLIQIGMLQRRQTWQEQPGVPIPRDEELLSRFLSSLPFELTSAQRRTLDQILEDMARPCPMSRLVQGDVGSGKTIVATAAMLMASAVGKQSALMAPTEILAEQHYRTVTAALERSGEWGLTRPVSVELLTGSLSQAGRRQVYAALTSGAADIVIGTHALIQREVNFRDLGLAVVDEQHRFGVVQRGTLRQKGNSPHVLVMSATPIPRSLALTLYGDLDISAIDELPPGRQPIYTRWLSPRERERAYGFLRSQIEKGRQAFVLYPLIEESDKVEARAAVDEYERLQTTVFPDLKLGLLHGRMTGKEKDDVMAAFRQGELDILVSTSVVEVGIDVPNATVMLVEGADRFGLAQLHQFRGRVGRGAHQSYCLLLSDAASPDDTGTQGTWERLKAIEETQDGFVLAEKDLELRGPGDFFGIRQSGLPTLRLASLSEVRVLEDARTEAQALFQDDPPLQKPEHQLLARQVAEFWQASDLVS